MTNSELRELRAEGSVNLPRDPAPMEHVPSDQWWCNYCPPADLLGTIVWLPLADGSEYGRCGRCGQKYQTVEVWHD